MKLLLENWRQYLLNEGMMTLDAMPEDFSIEIRKTGGAYPYEINLLRELAPGERARHKSVGQIGIEGIDPNDLWTRGSVGREEIDDVDVVTECEDSDQFDNFRKLYTFHVSVNDDIQKLGFGSLLADLAMELASMDNKLIIPAKLVGGAGTEGAIRLYNYYLHNRDDVEHYEIIPECWEYFTGEGLDKFNEYAEEFTYLYSKPNPTMLKSPLAKTKIIWKK